MLITGSRLGELETLGAKIKKPEKKDPRVGDAVRSAELAAQAANSAAESVGEIGEHIERLVDGMKRPTRLRVHRNAQGFIDYVDVE